MAEQHVSTRHTALALTRDHAGTRSYQVFAADLTPAAAAGKNLPDTAFIGPMMGNLWGNALTKTGVYLGGLIGHYSATGAKGTHMPAGAVLAGIGDGSTTADGAVVAYIDGDSAQTKAGAAFKVKHNNSTAGSGFNYGLDLYDAGHDGFNAVAFLKADIALSGSLSANERLIVASGSAANDAAIVAQVGADSGVADGSVYLSTAGNGAMFLKVNDVWVAVTHA